MTLSRFTSLLSAIIILIILELAIKSPEQIYWLVSSSFLVLLISLWSLTGYRLTKAKFWNFLINPFIFLAGVWLFLLFLEGKWMRQVIIFGAVILYWIFLKVVFLYLFKRVKYQAHTLGNISSYLNLIAIFLLTSSFFSLKIFFNFSFWPLVLVIAIVAWLLVYQLLWVSQISFFSSWRYASVVGLVVAEIFWVTSFLPTSIYVNGLIVTVVYYLLAGLSRNWLLGIKEGRVVRRYLTISLISLIIILVSAKWI